MSILSKRKINQLISGWPEGAVYLTSWLNKEGFSNQLLKKYKSSEWLKSIGPGALLRSGESATYEGGVFALQVQANSSIHPAAITALALQGKAHYLQLSNTKAILFGSAGERLPAWFTKAHWPIAVEYHSTSFLPADLGLIDIEHKTFSIKASGPARAIMECLYLTPDHQDLQECYDLMEGLTNLRPQLVQALLESCTSVKVKRLFLFLAEKAKHSWFEYLDQSKFDLGKGKRSIVKNGTLNTKYQITIPKELAQDAIL